MYFLALSQAPPVLLMLTASCTDDTMAPASSPDTACVRAHVSVFVRHSPVCLMRFSRGVCVCVFLMRLSHVCVNARALCGVRECVLAGGKGRASESAKRMLRDIRIYT